MRDTRRPKTDVLRRQRSNVVFREADDDEAAQPLFGQRKFGAARVVMAADQLFVRIANAAAIQAAINVR